MALVQDLAKDNLLYVAMQGCRAVLEKQLSIKSVIFSLSASVRAELKRRAKTDDALSFPYSYIALTSLGSIRDTQNNYAVKKHGNRFNTPGERATTTKGYTYPITLGLEFHYIDSDPMRLLSVAQALMLLSVTDGLTFDVNIGNLFTFVVRLEIPTETTLNIEEPGDPSLPGASDLTVQIVMHTTIGFFRDVSAVNGPSPIIGIGLAGTNFEITV